MKRSVEAKLTTAFLRLLSTGKPAAFEDAMRQVETGGERRRFGRIPAKLSRDGVIVKAGFRTSKNSSHNAANKQLWRLA